MSSWQVQDQKKPLFPDILWSRPENKLHAGKLLIIGGHGEDITEPMKAFEAANKAGVGVARVLLPDSAQKLLGKVFEAGDFCPSTKGGNFALNSLEQWLGEASWADCVLLCGGFGNNSETAILFEKFLDRYSGLLVLSGDSIDYLSKELAAKVLGRPSTVLYPSIKQLQSLLAFARDITPIFHKMNLSNFVEALQKISAKYSCVIAGMHEENYFVASGGKVVTQHDSNVTENMAARASVFWLQNPSKQLEAIASSFIYHT